MELVCVMDLGTRNHNTRVRRARRLHVLTGQAEYFCAEACSGGPVIDTRQRPGVPSYAGRPAVESSQGCSCGLPSTLSPVLLAGLTSRHRKSPPGRRRAVTSSNAFCLHTQGFYLTGNIQGWKKSLGNFPMQTLCKLCLKAL